MLGSSEPSMSVLTAMLLMPEHNMLMMWEHNKRTVVDVGTKLKTFVDAGTKKNTR